MPLYDYRCSRCKHEFEANVIVGRRDGFQTCPDCGAGSYRVFAACTVQRPPREWSSLTASDFLEDRKPEKTHFTVPGWGGQSPTREAWGGKLRASCEIASKEGK